MICDLINGTYAFNLAQFVVLTEDTIYYLSLNKNEEAVFKRMAELIAERGGFHPVVIKGADDLVGIVTVHDGPSPPQGEIIALITKDAFEPSLPLSVVVHIDYRQAPLVNQRFGDVKRLVEQTLDPMVAAYFKN